MRLTIERSTLLKALNHVTSVVESRTTIPILTHVLLEAATPASLRLKATDLDIEIVETVKADVTAPGALTASARMLYDIVRKLPDGSQVTLASGADDGRLSVICGRARFALASLPGSDFPDLGAAPMDRQFDIPVKSLIKLIDRTRFAVSTEETRYYLNGIFLHEFNGLLRAVATDGHRLAQVDVGLPEGASGMPSAIIPRKTVAEVYKLLADEHKDDSVRIGVSPNKIMVSIPGDQPDAPPRLVFTSKLIDGAFPDYTRVVPTGNDREMQAPVADFIRAVDRVSILAAEKGRAVKCEITADGLAMSCRNPDAGEAREELAVSYGAAPMEIGFNARYLLDVAQQIEGSQMVFMLGDASSPTIIRDNGDPAALYVLMPMRV